MQSHSGEIMGQTTTDKQLQKTVHVGSGRVFASHAALIQDMREYQQEVTKTPETSMSFLKRAGLVTASGKPKQLIRG
jgi:hypothetical protein